MPPVLLQSDQAGKRPSFLAIGHVTRDLLSSGRFSPGGTAAFAALTAYHLGQVSALVTRADQALLETLPSLLPDVGLAACVDPVTTTFENLYQEGTRIQYVRKHAAPLELADIPPSWLNTPVILLGPVAQEIPPTLVHELPRQPGSLLAAVPQGWLRRWSADGRVWPTPWESAEALLPLLDAVILSRDDLRPLASDNGEHVDTLLTRWSRLVPLLAATDGRNGADLFEQGTIRHFPAYPAIEVDPTGAGDVFATAFLIHLFQTKDPGSAMNFANCVASLSIEHPGLTGIPTQEQIQQRLRAYP